MESLTCGKQGIGPTRQRGICQFVDQRRAGLVVSD
jgi:hypothetical protein